MYWRPRIDYTFNIGVIQGLMIWDNGHDEFRVVFISSSSWKWRFDNLGVLDLRDELTDLGLGLSEAVIVSRPPEEEDGAPPRDDSENRVWSMGQLCGKFTVMPNWDDIL